MNEQTKKVINESLNGFGADNARVACKLHYRPTDEIYSEKNCLFRGCPTVAVTRGGRVYLGWYSGGTGEPRLENYNLVVYSDDGGKSFSSPYLVIPSEKERLVHALDIQLFLAPDGSLFVFWVQNNVRPLTEENEYMLEAMKSDKRPVVAYEGYIYPDMRHTAWCSVCEDPDADEPKFSEPRIVGNGFVRCKPLILSDGRWLVFNYDQLTDRYSFSVSTDGAKTFTPHSACEKIPTAFDETMAYEMRDGKIRMFARCTEGEIAESYSSDGAESFSPARLSGIKNANTRFFVSRTPTGRVILVHNDASPKRQRMSVWLSDDDGVNWQYKKTVGDPEHITSYPDVDFHDGKIYLTYDRGRTVEREIYLAVFTEDDIIDPNKVIETKVVSKHQ